MASIGNLVQKAFYLGVGLADYATEKAGVTIGELGAQAQKLADEMVARGEMTAEEARKYVNELIEQAQGTIKEPREDVQSREPRKIEIVSEEDDEDSSAKKEQEVEALQKQVQSLQEELHQLKRD